MPTLRTAATIDFDDAWAQLQLLSAAKKVNDAESAVFALRGLLNQTPDDPDLHGELAGVLLDIDKPEEALLHCRHAVVAITGGLTPRAAWWVVD